VSTPKQIIVILRWLYGFFVPIADAINPGHAAVSKPASCCPFWCQLTIFLQMIMLTLDKQSTSTDQRAVGNYSTPRDAM
jgi:hypothetical protein